MSSTDNFGELYDGVVKYGRLQALLNIVKNTHGEGPPCQPTAPTHHIRDEVRVTMQPLLRDAIVVLLPGQLPQDQRLV